MESILDILMNTSVEIINKKISCTNFFSSIYSEGTIISCNTKLSGATEMEVGDSNCSFVLWYEASERIRLLFIDRFVFQVYTCEGNHFQSR